MTDRTLYDAGWNDSIQFGIDRKHLDTGRAGLGMLLMLLAGIAVAMLLVVPLTMFITNQTIYNYTPLGWIAGVGIILGTVGFFLDKKEEARYKQRETEFYQKWIARWDELGFNGDE